MFFNFEAIMKSLLIPCFLALFCLPFHLQSAQNLDSSAIFSASVLIGYPASAWQPTSWEYNLINNITLPFFEAKVAYRFVPAWSIHAALGAGSTINSFEDTGIVRWRCGNEFDGLPWEETLFALTRKQRYTQQTIVVPVFWGIEHHFGLFSLGIEASSGLAFSSSRYVEYQSLQEGTIIFRPRLLYGVAATFGANIPLTEKHFLNAQLRGVISNAFLGGILSCGIGQIF